MIESSAHGDEYDGVMYSQLVSSAINHMLHLTVFIATLSRDSLLQNLIDLAGSESSKTETTGLRRKEGSYINKSLLTLGTVSMEYFYLISLTAFTIPSICSLKVLFRTSIFSSNCIYVYQIEILN